MPTDLFRLGPKPRDLILQSLSEMLPPTVRACLLALIAFGGLGWAGCAGVGVIWFWGWFCGGQGGTNPVPERVLSSGSVLLLRPHCSWVVVEEAYTGIAELKARSVEGKEQDPPTRGRTVTASTEPAYPRSPTRPPLVHRCVRAPSTPLQRNYTHDVEVCRLHSSDQLLLLALEYVPSTSQSTLNKPIKPLASTRSPRAAVGGFLWTTTSTRRSPLRPPLGRRLYPSLLDGTLRLGVSPEFGSPLTLVASFS